MKKVSIPCPDGLPGCMVAQYAWVPEEEGETLEERLTRENALLRETIDELEGNERQVAIFKRLISQTLKPEMSKLERSNKELKEGLKFYAEIQNWETFSTNVGQIATLIEEDTGLMARTILEKVKI